MTARTLLLLSTAALAVPAVPFLHAEPSRQDPGINAASGEEIAGKLPAPFAIKATSNQSRVLGWPAGKTPVAPEGFRVAAYAEMNNPHWLYQLPNGDVLVSQTGGGIFGGGSTITLLRDSDGDGKPEVKETFLKGLNKPFGLLLVGDALYVGLTDGLLRFPYQTGQRHIAAGARRS